MQTVTSKDGTRIAYEQSGEGTPVLVLGGALNDRRSAAPVASALSAFLSPVVVDRRGRGDSTDTAPYDVQREIEDLAAVIEGLGGSAAVYGHSSGAILALAAAAAGVPISRLIAFEPPYHVHGPEEKDHTHELRTLIEQDRRGDAVAYFMTETVGLPQEALAGIRQTPMWPGLEAVAPTLVYDSMIVGDGSIPKEMLATVGVPTLVLASTGSWPWILEATRTVADCVPDATLQMLDGGPHDVAPETVAPVIASFLDG